MKCWWVSLIAVMVLAGSPGASGETPREDRTTRLTDGELQQLDFKQYPGRRLPLGLSLVDEEGREVRLGDFFDGGKGGEAGKPVILVPGYFECRTLCSGLSDGLLHALQGSAKSAGKEFRVVYFSIDPNETLAQARERKATWIKRYGRRGISPDACRFLSGRPEVIAQLAEQIGFEYRYDPPTGEYAHMAGFLVVRPDGRISRYFFGVSFSAGELDRALDAAAQFKTGSIIEKFLLLCFHYNPIRSRYGAAIMWAVRGLALATIAGLIWLVARYQPKKRLSGKRSDPQTNPSTRLTP
ncbi:MAG TPA: SCO family protein [Chthoniobacteraceae bacterium]|nr:SCO family protein [Chthoniobacteraceae bacterium]